MRAVLAVLIWVVTASALAAQGLTGLARVSAEGSGVVAARGGGAVLSLSLSQGVPFRVFTLDAPRRLVVDLSEADFSALPARGGLVFDPEAVTGARYGSFQPGWSRLVLDLAQPLNPESVEMLVDAASGRAVLKVVLRPASAGAFGARAGAPPGAAPAAPPPVAAPQARQQRFTVVLDPGHGGVDPGAVWESLVEKEIALDFAISLRDLLRREGVRVVLTRDTDTFVSLESRIALAHQAGGSVFISLHADALSQGGASGATVYTLSDEASDLASARLAARHNRADILAGLDLTGADDEVTAVLLDLARRETEPRSAALADTVIAGMRASGGPMNRKPWRRGGFSVLKSADIPSILVELGFLSSARDRQNLADPAWRRSLAEGLALGILAWRDADAVRSGLVRQ